MKFILPFTWPVLQPPALDLHGLGDPVAAAAVDATRARHEQPAATPAAVAAVEAVRWEPHLQRTCSFQFTPPAYQVATGSACPELGYMLTTNTAVDLTDAFEG
jgi:hypothetical protein